MPTPKFLPRHIERDSSGTDRPMCLLATLRMDLPSLAIPMQTWYSRCEVFVLLQRGEVYDPTLLLFGFDFLLSQFHPGRHIMFTVVLQLFRILLGVSRYKCAEGVGKRKCWQSYQSVVNEAIPSGMICDMVPILQSLVGLGEHKQSMARQYSVPSANPTKPSMASHSSLSTLAPELLYSIFKLLDHPSKVSLGLALP